ncbi:hypothetical protein K457DRAFT_135535 [Linnemannia elongata AG-77]|uniref:AI-2E family transporter n=1 Tax=Linnemannia elongata AG-77 TaxID=1314771 RepID=A0A197K6Z6_9FUNG|nr:hypothetical protein K457DRAFT_135535 [Linnemannia elongata AG-77]
MQPKDALVLCTVTVLFIYFGIILWTNYAIIIPFWTPIFWAAALSVPLHALKTRLLPPLHNALEDDLMDTIASAIGGVATYILRFFVGSHIANAVKAVFLGYCYVVYMLCDGRPRDNKDKKTTTPVKDESYANDKVDREEDFPEERQLNRIDDDDYELHPDYQALVDQEQDGYARPANWPSYTNLLRAAFIYGLLQLGTPSELWSGVKAIWSEIEFGTQQQFNILMVAVLLHIQYSCLGQIVAMIERVIYPKLTPEQYKERSIINTVPKMFRKALQESLNSTLTTTIVLSTIAVVGTLVAILSVGVAHDVQGLLAQTHHRVMGFREEKARWTLENAQDTGAPPVPKSALVNQVDDALSQAYDAGLQWFDPILKDAFPDLTWGATEWAFQLAHVVVDLDHFQSAAAAAKAAAQASAAAAAAAAAADAKAKATCEAPEEKKVDLNELLLHPADQTTLSLKDFASTRTDTEEHNSHNDNNDNNDHNDNNDINDTNEIHDHTTLEEPELWPIPTLRSLLLSGSDNKDAFGILSGNDFSNTPRQKAINVSQAKYLLSIIFGYKGFDTPMMLWGFNVFNDLLFRGILFMLVLMTFTGLKVSPLQRLGWIIDQALGSSTNFGSFHLSDTYSPGRVLAKSLEFSISGTFISMFKLSIYHTLFTLAWTHFLTDRVTLLVAAGEASPDFVPIKYAWLTSLFGIVLTLFPIAPNWLVAIPGGLVHFYIYGQRSMEAIAMVVGHLLLANLVDGAVWDSHVVKNARPGVSSAFWLGLWVFLGGMKWGPKGLLLGPVFFAAVPSIWSALLELRGKPSRGLTRHRGARLSTTATEVDQSSLKDGKSHGSAGATPRKGYRQEFYGEYELEENTSRRSSRSSSVSSSRNSRGQSAPRSVNGYRRDEKSAAFAHR